MAYFYYAKGPGRKGLVKVETHYALCLCGTTELKSESLTAAVRDLKEAGWTNGHPLDGAPLPGARSEQTEWRCPECVVPCPRCRPDLEGEIYARRARVGDICDVCKDERED